MDAERVQLTQPQVFAMLEIGELSVSLWYRRHTLLTLCELAARSKGHDPLSRWRLKRFRAPIEAGADAPATGGRLAAA